MTPGQLVTAVSIAMNVPLETVTQHDRNLAIVGLRTMGARGVNAPHVTTLDAARLVVATLASARTKDLVETVLEYESIIFDSGNPGKRSLLIPELADLPDRHNFVEALASLIERASASLTANEAEKLLQQMAGLSIECQLPATTASIEIQAEGRYNLYAGKAFSSRVLAAAAASAEGRDAYGGLRLVGIRQTRSIGGNVMLIIGLAFRKNGLKYTTAPAAINALVESHAKAGKAKKRGA
jgi:hypothetical protein